MVKAFCVFLIFATVWCNLNACTSWVIAPDTYENGRFLLHKTRDWGKGTPIPVNIYFPEFPGGKYKVLGHSPYMLFNEKGLGMIDTALPKTTDIPKDTPLLLIGKTMCMVAFNCATVREGLEVLTKLTQDGSNPTTDHYILCDTKEAAIVEISPKHISYSFIKNGFAVHTNHHIYTDTAYLSEGKLESNIQSATRLLITQDALHVAMKNNNGKITSDDSLNLARLYDDEKYPGMCPFRNSTVCSTDYSPDPEYPGILGTFRFCPGPTCYAVAIPFAMGVQNIPKVLEDDTYGQLAYKIKSLKPDRKELLAKFKPLEDEFWKAYMDAIEQARALLKDGKKQEALDLLQALTDKQVAQAFELMTSVVNDLTQKQNEK